jgi:4-amino-4-deoxy-L-arabinose transferase-like glycosyltransferase
MIAPTAPADAATLARRSQLIVGAAPWIAILVLALLPRLFFVALAPDHLQFPDAREYQGVALQLYEQGSYGHFALRPPGYPTLIAAVYAVFGPHLIALRVVEAVLSVISVWLIGIVGARLFGRRAGMLSALIAALHPVLAFLPTIGYSENTLVLVAVLALGATFAAWRGGGSWLWCVSGALWGLALLVRPSTVLVLPGLALGLALALRVERRSLLVPALLCALTAALTVTPWLVRNHREHGAWFFIATGGGRQFWTGNNPRAEADSRVSGFLPDSAMASAMSRMSSEVELDRYYYRQGAAFVREHPGRAAVLYLKELRNLFAFYPETHSRLYITTWSRWAQGVASAILFAGAFLGLRFFRRDPRMWVLLLPVVSFALGSAFFFTIMRYRMTVEPCLLWMAGAGWDAALARRERPGKRPAGSHG